MDKNSISALGAFAGALAPGNLDRLRSVTTDVVPGRLAAGEAYELLLQSHLFFGYPQAIEAARIFRETVTAANIALTEPPPEQREPEEFRERGRHFCERVYRPNFERLMGNLTAISPELTGWMLTNAYGMVLSRPGPTALARELASVVFLAHSGHRTQLFSHVRGVRNLGGSVAEILTVVGEAGLNKQQMGVVEEVARQVFRT